MLLSAKKSQGLFFVQVISSILETPNNLEKDKAFASRSVSQIMQYRITVH